MESSVTHGKNSLSSSANRKNISFVVVIAKFQCAALRGVANLWVGLPDVLMSAGDASGFPRISSHSSRWENFCSWQAWRILLNQVRLENQTNLNPVCTQTKTLRLKNFINFIFSWCQLSRYKISRTNDESRVIHNTSAVCLVVWFSLESVEIILSDSRNADWCMCKLAVLFWREFAWCFELVFVKTKGGCGPVRSPGQGERRELDSIFSEGWYYHIIS